VPASSPHENKQRPSKKSGKKEEQPNNPAMAEALLAGGLKPAAKATPPQETGLPPNPVKPRKKNAPDARKAIPQQAKKLTISTKADRQKTKARTKKKGAMVASPPASDAKKVAKRRKRFMASMKTKVSPGLKPLDLRWHQRQAEIAELIATIQRASFGKLISEWKKHVGFAGYIQETGRRVERLETYLSLIKAIENEWGRRSKLAFNNDEYFDWPSTHAARSNRGVAMVDWASEGYLAYLGYHVGERSDLTRTQRWAILRRVFEMILPPLETPDYVRSWGAPASAVRLKKMADSLASFARSAKRRSGASFALAISQWEADLAMLHDEFYVAKFGFGWPRI
jgi:hypothetical protein